MIAPLLERRPLGKYISKTHQTWPARLSEDDKYMRYGTSTYKKCTKTRNPQYRVCSDQDIYYIKLADIQILPSGNVQVLGKNFKPTEERESEPTTVMDYFNKAPEWQRRIWGTGNINEESLIVLIMNLINDNVASGGDGSVKNGSAAHAWSLVRKNDYTPIIEGAGPSDGDPLYLSSLRPETIACIAVASLLHMVTSAANISNKFVPFYTDSLSVVQHATVHHWHASKNIYDKDIDVILENNRLLKKLKITLVPTHVLGHQDNVKDYNDLTDPERLNVRMDRLATQFLESHHQHLTPTTSPLIFPAQQVCVLQNDKALTDDIPNQLVLEKKQVIIRHYFQKHFNLSEHALDLVDWKCFGFVMTKNKKRRQLLKGFHHLWNTRVITFKWNQSTSNMCPFCKSESETWQHVLRCNNEHIVRTRSTFLTTFDRGLEAMHTEPNLKKWLIRGMNSWFSNNNVGEPALYAINNINVHAAYEAQKEIGFDSLMQGLIASEIRSVQEKYYKDGKYPLKYNGIRWMKFVIRNLLEFCHDVWTERCTVVVASTNEIHEHRTRMRTWARLPEIKREQWKIPAVCRDVLNRDRNFFTKAPFLQIEMWLIRLNSAIEQGQNTDGIRDIRTYGTQLREVTGNRRVRTKKKYKVGIRKRQQNIFSYLPNLRH